MKVKITQCSNPNYWYSNMILETVEVTGENETDYLIEVEEGGRLIVASIAKCDAERTNA